MEPVHGPKPGGQNGVHTSILMVAKQDTLPAVVHPPECVARNTTKAPSQNGFWRRISASGFRDGSFSCPSHLIDLVMLMNDSSVADSSGSETGPLLDGSYWNSLHRQSISMYRGSAQTQLSFRLWSSAIITLLIWAMVISECVGQLVWPTVCLGWCWSNVCRLQHNEFCDAAPGHSQQRRSTWKTCRGVGVSGAYGVNPTNSV